MANKEVKPKRNTKLKVKRGGHSKNGVNSKVWQWCKGKPSKVIEALADSSLRDVALKIGVTHSTLYEWLLRQEGDYAVQVADKIAVETVEVADNDDQPARARNRINVRQFILERRFPKRYGRRDQLDVSGTVDIVSRLQNARRRLADTVIEGKLVDS